MRLSRYEQETIINFNEEDDWADVYTHNKKLVERLKRIAADFPEECTFKDKTGYGAYRFTVSKRLVAIHLPRSKSWRENMRNHAKVNNWNPLLNGEK